MKKEFLHSAHLMVWTSLLGLVLLTACSHDIEGEKPLEYVKAQFNFSFPLKRASASTRMEGDVVQNHGTDDQFRGITDVRLFCYNTMPTKDNAKIGNVIEMKTSDATVEKEVTNEDYSLCEEIQIPVTTNHFGFYARALDAPTTHEDMMKYGIVETVGLSKSSYTDNAHMRFKPVPICTSAADFGGSEAGQNLLILLNDLMDTKAAVAAPNDKWATVNDMYLNEAYQRMTALRCLSSDHIQIMLGAINRILHQTAVDNQGDALRNALKNKILSYSTDTISKITLKPEYRNFPTDINLPVGSARVEWNATHEKFEVPATHNYGSTISVSSLNHYVYPMNLQYQIISDIKASDDLVIQADEASGGSTEYQNWSELVQDGYDGAANEVKNTTQSVVMVKQVEYAVGSMALRTIIDPPGGGVKDAKDKLVDISNGFTLKGYVVGGQREVDYNFKPLSDSPTYAIYDSYLNGGKTQHVDQDDYTPVDYILGLGTEGGQKINVALELVNDCHDFQGADGVIAKGATFYLVAELDPGAASNIIFNRAHATTVKISIKSLASATYGLPDLDIPHPTVGISVNLTWEDGLRYGNVEL